MTTHEILGRQVTMPVMVRDATAATVIWDVDAEAAGQLAPPGFAVVESQPGRSQFALALVDYRDNDLGTYREIGTMLFVRPEGGGPDGNFITHLPVDQEFTCAAGNLIWGFPKTVEQITVTDTDASSRWVLHMDGELVLDVTLPRGGSDVLPDMELTTYTMLRGRRHATRFIQGGSGAAFRFGAAAAVSLTLGEHRIAKELASLGLPAPPTLATWTQAMQGRFEEPQPL
jgi:hypothetical protein